MTSSHQGRRPVALVLSIAVCYAGAVLLGRVTRRTAAAQSRIVMALPSPEIARVSSLGFYGAVADLYFFRATQYYGGEASFWDYYQHLPPLLEVITTVDPKWALPVWWGAIAMERNLGNETWLNVPESSRLLQKGIERFPNDWRFYFYLAYNRSTFDRRYREAAKLIQDAVKVGGGPAYLPELATRLYATAGDLGTAAAFAHVMIDTTKDPALKAAMKKREVDIETERRLRLIDAGIVRYHDAFGRWPKRIADLLETSMLANLPAEPREGGWYIDGASHTARSTMMKGRLLVYRAPTRTDTETQPLRELLKHEEKTTPPHASVMP